jgi:hypothetical protein
VRALTVMLLLGGCFETIEHTPAGVCTSSFDCPCDTDCYVPDGGDITVCGPRITPLCASVHDCLGAGLTCLHRVRDGGACNYTQCQ